MYEGDCLISAPPYAASIVPERHFTYLNEPRLKVLVDDDVVSVALVAVPVRDHDRGHGLEAVHDEPGHLVEELLRGGLAARRLQEELEVLHGELAAVDVVVLLAVLLDGDVGQVDVHVVHLADGVVVLDGAKPAEAVLEQVGLQRAEGGHQNVKPEIMNRAI